MAYYRDPRAGKTYQLSWPEWIEFCAEHGIEPTEECEHGFDLGLGESYTIACYDLPDEVEHLQEIQHREDVFSLRRWKGEE